LEAAAAEAAEAEAAAQMQRRNPLDAWLPRLLEILLRSL